MEVTLTAREFLQWQILISERGPLGQARTDLQFAQLNDTIAKVAGAKTSLRDFMLFEHTPLDPPGDDPEPETATAQQVIGMFPADKVKFIKRSKV